MSTQCWLAFRPLISNVKLVLVGNYPPVNNSKQSAGKYTIGKTQWGWFVVNGAKIEKLTQSTGKVSRIKWRQN